MLSTNFESFAAEGRSSSPEPIKLSPHICKASRHPGERWTLVLDAFFSQAVRLIPSGNALVPNCSAAIPFLFQSQPYFLAGAKAVVVSNDGLLDWHGIPISIWPMASQESFRRGRHVVFKLSVHLVFVTKYRKKCISGRAFDVILESWQRTCEKFECEIQEANHDGDHAHLLLSYPPKVALSTLVNSLKGASSHSLRTKHFPEVSKALWGKAFWSPSYCAVSCGGAPLEIVKQYVQNQRT